MYKETIISIVIIIFVFVLNNIAQNHTDNSLGKIDEDLYNLRSKIEKVLDKEETANREIQEDIDKIIEEWEKQYYVLAIYLEHDELEKVKKELVILKSNIELGQYKAAITDIDRGTFALEHLKEKEVLNVDNFF